MSSDRRKEIEAKRAKLEELREARNRRSKLKNADAVSATLCTKFRDLSLLDNTW